MLLAVRRHWPEYLMEAAGLGLFMISASAFGALLEHPASPLRGAIEPALARRLLMGLAMAATAVAIVYSPWGKRSGAHINPAVTLTFWSLRRVRSADALLYMLSQAAGGAAGVLLASWALRGILADPAVNYVATVPGPAGPVPAFGAEVAISFGMMLVVLGTADSERLGRFTGLFAGGLVATYITLEAPISGMSMNPARSLASAIPAGAWGSFWIYLAAPPTGMLLAALVWKLARPSARGCAKLHHANAARCIFRCEMEHESAAAGQRSCAPASRA